MSQVTELLEAIDRGDARATDELFPIVYEELKRIAKGKIVAERPGLSLGATELVHEAYLRLIGEGQRSEVGSQKSDEQIPTSDLRPLTSGNWNSRGHFFAAAAEAMRRILIDHARRRLALVRGGDRERVSLTEVEERMQKGAFAERKPTNDQRLLDLDEALRRLEAEDPQKGTLVKLRFFAGLTNEEAAAALGISTATAQRMWAYSRAWLRTAVE
jgi:RNA polymerase sigma factor (TIGR02999 family)